MGQEVPKPVYEVPRPLLYRGIKFLAPRTVLKNIEITSGGIDHVPFRDGVSAAANHRNDDFDVLTAGLVLSERRAAYYPAKQELDDGLRGWILKNCGALYFKREDKADRKRVFELSDRHIKAGHMVLTMVEGTSKTTGSRLKETYDGATRLAINNELDRVVLVGIGGSDTPFRTDPEGLSRQKREKPSRMHIEIGSVSLLPLLEEYRQAEKTVPIRAKKEFHADIVIPGLQEVVDIAYERAAA